MKKLIGFILVLNLFNNLTSIAQCWETVAAGAAHSAAIRSDGTLWTFGNTTYGQLGILTQYNQFSPVQVGLEKKWKKISSKSLFNLAIKTDGTLWAWGYNYYGQVGDGSNITRYEPVQIGTDSDWKEIAAGVNHSLALKTNGTLWAWGYNSDSQLGLGTSTDSNIPVQIGTDADWQSIAAGDDHSLALKSGRTLWAWGSNFYGQLGTGVIHVTKNIPTQIGTDTDWQSIAAGNDHSLAIKSNGSLWTCGYNYYGQLGDGTNTDKIVFTQMGTATNWKESKGGIAHSVATKTDGTLWTWGRNDNGTLGDGTVTNRNAPVSIIAAVDWNSIAAGYTHTIVASSADTIWVWGQGFVGALGLGNGYDNYSPGRINTNCNYSKISISQSGNRILSGATINMGSEQAGTSGTPLQLVIGNFGNINLTLTGGSMVTVSGTNASDFIIVQPSSATVLPSATTSFDVTFHPSAGGTRSAVLTIVSNDASQSSYTINLTGTATVPLVPEINIKQNATNYLTGATYNYGNLTLNTSSTPSLFVIENTGTASLTISSMTLTGTNNMDFVLSSLSLPAVITAGNTFSFSLQFSPLSTGVKSALLTVSNDDADEGTYTINLAGTSSAVSSVPPSTTGIEEAQTSIAKISPNPFSENILVEIGAIMPGAVEIKVKNILGMEVMVVSGSNSSEFILSMPNLPPGIYVMEIITEIGKTVKYIVKN